jgi:hypothetical protein
MVKTERQKLFLLPSGNNSLNFTDNTKIVQFIKK